METDRREGRLEIKLSKATEFRFVSDIDLFVCTVIGDKTELFTDSCSTQRFTSKTRKSVYSPSAVKKRCLTGMTQPGVGWGSFLTSQAVK